MEWRGWTQEDHDFNLPKLEFTAKSHYDGKKIDDEAGHIAQEFDFYWGVNGILNQNLKFTMKKSIQTERHRMDKVTYDILDEEMIHRRMACSMIQAMPLDMLQRLLPLKTDSDGDVIALEIRIEV
jgi:hypothetical protein